MNRAKLKKAIYYAALIGCISFCQNIYGQWQFYFGLNNYVNKSHTYVDESRITKTTEFKYSPGTSLGTCRRVPLKNKLSLSFGLGFEISYRRLISKEQYSGFFKYDEPGRLSGFLHLSEEPTSLSGYFDYTENFKQLAAQLEIPFQLNYNLNDKWDISLCAKMFSPILTRNRATKRVLERSVNESQLYIKHEPDGPPDKSGSFFRDYSIATSIEIIYWKSRWGFAAEGGKLLTNIYAKTWVARPYFLQLKIYFRLNNNKEFKHQ